MPLDAVVECMELPPRSRAAPRAAASSTCAARRCRTCACGDLLRPRRAAAGARENVVVVRHDGELRGLVVDTLLGESQTVIKPLGKMFRGLPGVAGSTILGNGRVALILDVPGLFELPSSNAAGDPRPDEIPS